MYLPTTSQETDSTIVSMLSCFQLRLHVECLNLSDIIYLIKNIKTKTYFFCPELNITIITTSGLTKKVTIVEVSTTLLSDDIMRLWIKD